MENFLSEYQQPPFNINSYISILLMICAACRRAIPEPVVRDSKGREQLLAAFLLVLICQ